VRKWIRNIDALEAAQPTAKLVQKVRTQHRQLASPMEMYDDDSETESIDSSLSEGHGSHEQSPTGVSRATHLPCALATAFVPVVPILSAPPHFPILLSPLGNSHPSQAPVAAPVAAPVDTQRDWAETMRVASDLLALTRG